MRGRILLGGLLALGLVGGCGPARHQIRPPVTKEVITEPPTADARYNSPPEYPRSVLNKGPIVRSTDNVNPQGPQQTGFQQSSAGMQPGM